MTDNNENKVLNVPHLRFPEFSGEWKKYSFNDIAQYKKGPFGSALKKEIFVPKSADSVKIYEQQNAIKKDWELGRYYISRDYFINHMQQFIVEAGDIIVSCAGTIGEIYELPPNAVSGVFNQALMRVRINATLIDKNIFIKVFSSMIDSFSKIYSNGSAIKNIPPFADLKKTNVFLPTQNEQYKISRLISLLDERIATQNKIIEKLQSLIKGLSQQLLSSENDWILYRLDDLAQIKSGYSGTQVSYQTPYKVSRIETISKHCIDIQRIGYVECIPESYRLNVGNILFSNINSIQYIGNTAYLDKDYGLYHGMNLLRIIPNTTIVRPRFLHLLLCTDWAINHFQTICNKAVSQASINQTALGKSRFPIPPMSVQQQICSMFELTERKLDNEQEYISCLQQQKRYLLQKMFI